MKSHGISGVICSVLELDSVGLGWCRQEILQVLHEHGESVVAVFAGHDHDGGASVEPLQTALDVCSVVLLRAVFWGE